MNSWLEVKASVPVRCCSVRKQKGRVAKGRFFSRLDVILITKPTTERGASTKIAENVFFFNDNNNNGTNNSGSKATKTTGAYFGEIDSPRRKKSHKIPAILIVHFQYSDGEFWV